MNVNQKSINQGLVIEDAQIKIKMICKDGVLKRLSKESISRQINKVISDAISQTESEQTKKRIKEVLASFANKIYVWQYNLMRDYATWFSIVGLAFLNKDKQAKTYMKELNNNMAVSVRNSPFFMHIKEQITENPTEYYDRGVPLQMYHKEYMQKVRSENARIISQEAKPDYALNVNLRNIAEMNIRYDYNMSKLEKYKKQGVKLIYILAHANCSERCEKWQVGGENNPSGLYSLDGTDGYTDDKNHLHYIPIEKATDVYTGKNKKYKNGCLSGFNCRHKTTPYRTDFEPHTISAKTIEKQRALEKKQRVYERTIREYKTSYFQNRDIDYAKAQASRKKAEKLNKEYEKFSRDNNIPFFRERTRIFTELNNGNERLK